MNASNAATPGANPAMARIVEQNIEALLARREVDERRKGLQSRVADGITHFTGSMLFVYIHIALFGGWIAVNLGWLPILPPFDPTFVVLAMFASVEAIFLSTFVLITQNRLAQQADRRADLDLQISLLAEHEVTTLIKLVAAIAERSGIDLAQNPELKELSRDVRPEQVLDKIEATENSRGESP